MAKYKLFMLNQKDANSSFFGTSKDSYKDEESAYKKAMSEMNLMKLDGLGSGELYEVSTRFSKGVSLGTTETFDILIVIMPTEMADRVDELMEKFNGNDDLQGLVLEATMNALNIERGKKILTEIL